MGRADQGERRERRLNYRGRLGWRQIDSLLGQ
jgi:hypothetical protein